MLVKAGDHFAALIYTVGRMVKNFLLTTAGILAGLLVFEVGLRPFNFEYTKGKSYEVRQYSEGIAVSRFILSDPAPLMWRRTGNEPINGAPVLLIVGDSHVAAKQVADDQTMGSWIERWARSEGRLLNVRQYGLSGGSAAAYAGFADLLLARWNPVFVVVVLTANDLREIAVSNALYWGLRIRSEAPPEIFKGRHPHERMLKAQADLTSFERFLRGSALVQMLYFRCRSIKERGLSKHLEVLTPEQVNEIPRASVSVLKQAYGSRLMLVYLPDSRKLKKAPQEKELKIQEACRKEMIPYSSCRNEFFLMERRFESPTGFHNTRPGYGHINVKGHRAIAEIIWKLFKQVESGS